MNYGSETLPKVPPNLRRLPSAEDWDDRFHLSRIPPYDARTDKYMRKRQPSGSTGAEQLRRTLKTPIKRPSSISRLAPLSRTRINSRHTLIATRSNPKSRLSRSDEDSVVELQSRLNAAWAAWAVPTGHRVNVQKLIPIKGKTVSDMLRDELSRLEATHHPTKVVERIIEKREDLLVQLQNIDCTDDSKQLEAAELLSDLRLTSLDAVEAILRWRDYNRSIGPYLYKDQSYFAKMKTDTEFLKAMDKWFYIPPESDPFLLHAAGARTFTKTFPKVVKGDLRIPLPFVGNELHRIKQAEVILNAEQEVREERKVEIRKEERRISRNMPTIATPQPIDLMAVDELSSLGSRPQVTPISHLEDICSLFLDDFVSILVRDSVSTIVIESCQDVVAASLTLYSSTILDRLIVLVLELEIPLCAQESYSEELDREYIAFQQEIVEAAVTLEVKKWTEIWVRAEMAVEIARKYAQEVPVLEVVMESIEEETKLNRDLMILLYNHLVEDFISQEWFEILCENEFSDSILEERYKELPISVVRKLRQERPDQESLRISEELYRDMLYSYVSGLWLSQLVSAELSSGTVEDEDKAIFAFEIVVPKRTSQGMGRYYMS